MSSVFSLVGFFAGALFGIWLLPSTLQQLARRRRRRPAAGRRARHRRRAARLAGAVPRQPRRWTRSGRRLGWRALRRVDHRARCRGRRHGRRAHRRLPRLVAAHHRQPGAGQGHRRLQGAPDPRPDRAGADLAGLRRLPQLPVAARLPAGLRRPRAGADHPGPAARRRGRPAARRRSGGGLRRQGHDPLRLVPRATRRAPAGSSHPAASSPTPTSSRAPSDPASRRRPQTLSGDVVLLDPRRDLAIITVPGLDAPALPLGGRPVGRALRRQSPATRSTVPTASLPPGCGGSSTRAASTSTARTTWCARSTRSPRRSSPATPVAPCSTPRGGSSASSSPSRSRTHSTGYALTLDEARPVLDAGAHGRASRRQRRLPGRLSGPRPDGIRPHPLTRTVRSWSNSVVYQCVRWSNGAFGARGRGVGARASALPVCRRAGLGAASRKSAAAGSAMIESTPSARKVCSRSGGSGVWGAGGQWALTARTGQDASSRRRWAVEPSSSLPTAVRCRRPMTSSRDLLGLDQVEDLLGRVGAVLDPAHLVLDPRLGELAHRPGPGRSSRRAGRRRACRRGTC